VGAASGQALATQPVIEIRDAAGNRTTSTASVTAAIASGTGGTLGGTATVAAVNGTATFTNLAITGAGTYTLGFSATGLTAATSGNVTITGGTSSGIVVALGNSATATGTVGSNLIIPINVDLSNRGSLDIAALTVTVTWDTARFTYQGHSAGNWVDESEDAASVTPNAAQAAAGTYSVTGFTTGATVSSFVMRNISLRPKVAGAGTVAVAVSAAGNAAGSSILSSVTTRNLTVTSASPGVPPAGIRGTAPTAPNDRGAAVRSRLRGQD
jgi:hypothetical protein